MSNNIYNLEIILDSINKELEVFLQDNHLILIQNEKKDSYNFDGRTVFVNLFDGITTLVAILSIEEKLFQTCFNKCFHNICKVEREELEEAMPSEIINLIVGLSIRHFPEELDNFILGLPYVPSKEERDLLFEKNSYRWSEITTNDGTIRIGILELS